MKTVGILMALDLIVLAEMLSILLLLGKTGAEAAAWFLLMAAATGWASFLTLAIYPKE